MARSKKKDWEIAHTRKRILACAATVFARKGFAGTSMREIADEAGYSTASLYTYFKSKHVLVEGLRESMAEQMIAPFTMTLPAGLTFAQSLEIFLRSQARWVEDNRDAFRFFMRHGDVGSDHDLTDQYIDALADWISKHASSTDLGACNPRTAAVLMHGIGGALFQEWLRGQEDVSLQSVIDVQIAFFMGGIACQLR